MLATTGDPGDIAAEAGMPNGLALTWRAARQHQPRSFPADERTSKNVRIYTVDQD